MSLDPIIEGRIRLLFGGKCFVLVLHLNQRLLLFVCLFTTFLFNAKVVKHLLTFKEFLYLRHGINVTSIKHENGLVLFFACFLGWFQWGDYPTKFS